MRKYRYCQTLFIYQMHSCFSNRLRIFTAKYYEEFTIYLNGMKGNMCTQTDKSKGGRRPEGKGLAHIWLVLNTQNTNLYFIGIIVCVVLYGFFLFNDVTSTTNLFIK